MVPGIVIVLLGLFVVLVPAVIFPTCETQIETAAGGTVPMRCFWSGRAEIGIGALIAASGLLMLAFRPALVRAGIAVATALLGVLGILIPTVLIGGCESPMMDCNTTTFPAVIVANSLIVVVCVITALVLARSDRRLQVQAQQQATTNVTLDERGATHIEH
jgi:hypothetical protein